MEIRKQLKNIFKNKVKPLILKNYNLVKKATENKNVPGDELIGYSHTKKTAKKYYNKKVREDFKTIKKRNRLDRYLLKTN